jgi:hypothetical protein|tara:strand:+ start:474 stop:941 length:468 start_codon:yes stop_codon:yes gene_type:complete
MSAASNYLELELLDHTLGRGARDYASPSLYAALFSGTASDVGVALESGSMANTSGNWGYYEINNASYARQTIGFATASGGSAASNVVVTFPQATANYNNPATGGSTVNYVAIVDQVSDGSSTCNVLFYGALTNPKEILNGDTMSIASGSLTVSLA